MINPTELKPEILFLSFISSKRKERIGFIEHTALIFQASGHFTLETAGERTSMQQGEIMLVKKNQLGEITKLPLEGQQYQTIVILLKEELLRKIALQERIENVPKYSGPSNILIPANDYLQGFFQSVIPYVLHADQEITQALGIFKVREAVKLLLHTHPGLRDFLFDFSEPHKVDLEKFMLNNFQFNIPLEKFAILTGRSMAGFKRDFKKTFNMPPRQWLLEIRLNEARHLIEKKNGKSSSIYLDLGFESLSHFSSSFKKKFGKSPTAW
ncbi:AraC-type DNA-binding protein [Pedobacter westerhofensis]|uniref:AraC-type DNA-binding protein n=1 Tax=Pedobacter westerhofensis TaxID=425512 RepID=A0A521ATV7_9SPHI|nr:AraC family transcriptional regulator [Pedobacter westerhofensis]SMO38244.1 AraC-type DNA-binding protein [Pedobacter westerhofensis]